MCGPAVQVKNVSVSKNRAPSTGTELLHLKTKANYDLYQIIYLKN